MKKLKSLFLGSTLALITGTALAAPSYLITHNTTDAESNAYIAGRPSIYPTKPHSDKKLNWALVRLACFGHTSGDKCKAEIFMESNTSHKKSLGFLTMNLKTGEITPRKLQKSGYRIIVNRPGETTISKLK